MKETLAISRCWIGPQECPATPSLRMPVSTERAGWVRDSRRLVDVGHQLPADTEANPSRVDRLFRISRDTEDICQETAD